MLATNENSVTIFQLDDTAVRGRSVCLNTALNQALTDQSSKQARYPETVSRLLGEAMLIGAIVARALKFKGRLIVQCHGTNEGAVSLLVADCTTDGHIRGYARWDEARLKEIELDSRHPGARTLLGPGTFSMTIDQGPEMDQYQGLAAIAGQALSECAEHYFLQSEQIPTRIKLACGQIQIPGQAPQWRGGAMMIQRVAEDISRGDTDETWRTASALFDTLTDAELLEPALSTDALLYRLFHETGVRVIDRQSVEARCACSEERLRATLSAFTPEALKDIAQEGNITANCEFCANDYSFKLSEFVDK